MSVQLMHVEYWPSNMAPPKGGFEPLSRWLDERNRTEATLDAATRAE